MFKMEVDDCKLILENTDLVLVKDGDKWIYI